MVRGERRKRWESVSLSLKNQERAFYEVVLSSDGIMLQSDIVSALPVSMSTVSRMLEPHENRGLVERRRGAWKPFSCPNRMVSAFRTGAYAYNESDSWRHTAMTATE